MIHLNIIPENQKRDIKIKYFYDQSKILFEVLFFFLVVYVTVFLIFKLILANHFVTTINDTTMLTKRTEDYSRKVSDINKKITSTSEIQDNFVYWSRLIDIVRENQSEGLTLTQISISKKTNQITLAGTAKTRDDLLAFKKKIENLGYFKDIDLPIQNLLQKNNLSFSLIVKINSYEFK